MHHHEDPRASPLERVQALAQSLSMLTERVRLTVYEAISETVARIASDATRGMLYRLVDTEHDEYTAEVEYDAWHEPERIVSGSSKPVLSLEQRQAIERAIAAGLATAGWLLRRGRPWTALGVGTTVAATVVAGSQVSRRGLNLTGTLAELVSLIVPLTRRV